MPNKKRKLDDLRRSATKPGQTKIRFTVLSDKTKNVASGSSTGDLTDSTAKEMVQLSLSVKWVGGRNETIEDLVGTYDISSVDNNVIVVDVQDALRRLDFLPSTNESRWGDDDEPNESTPASISTDISCNVAPEITIPGENRDTSENSSEIIRQCYSDTSKSDISYRELTGNTCLESNDYQSTVDETFIADTSTVISTNLEPKTTLSKGSRTLSENCLGALPQCHSEAETLFDELSEDTLTPCVLIPPSTNLPISSGRSNVLELISKPFHPLTDYVFKKTKNQKGDRSRSCLSKWFHMPRPNGFPWLHYRPESDTVICFICANQYQKGNLKPVANLKLTFVTTGFSKWKKATQKFNEHQSSQCHQTALTYESTISRCKDIVEMTDSATAIARQDERAYFIKLMDALQFLGRQGIALRGHEEDDNFTQALLLRGKGDSRVKERLSADKGKRKKYTHNDYQNEILEIMSRHVLSNLLEDVRKSPFFAIMGDEYTDIANKEQLSVCIRWIQPESLNVFEDFVGFYKIRDIKSDTIVDAIKDVLIRLQLPLSKLRGQTYDGASNMLGKKSGVATQIKALQPKALETHCHGHSLNLSVKGVTNELPILRDTMGTVGEMCVLVKFSPKREGLLGEIQENLEREDDVSGKPKLVTLDKLCATRWTVRANCYKKVLCAYDALFDLWELTLRNGKLDTDVKSRIIGCQAQMKKFSFYFGLNLGQKFYSMTDNLSSALQSKKMSAITGQQLARTTISVIEDMRNDRDADLMFELVKLSAASHPNVEEPTLTRKRNNPKYSLLNFLDGCTSTAEAHCPKTPSQHFRQVYFEVIDAFVNSLKDRFEQASYNHFAKLENVLLTGVKGREVFSEGVKLLESKYGDDVNIDSLLEVELPLLANICKDIYVVCFEDILNHLKSVPEKLPLIPNVVSVVMLLLVNPSTSATPERSFSLARRIKTWTRSTMTQKRFNSVAILNCHKLHTDKIDLVKIGNEFISKNNERKITFGKFVNTDLQ